MFFYEVGLLVPRSTLLLPHGLGTGIGGVMPCALTHYFSDSLGEGERPFFLFPGISSSILVLLFTSTLKLLDNASFRVSAGFPQQHEQFNNGTVATLSEVATIVVSLFFLSRVRP